VFKAPEPFKALRYRRTVATCGILAANATSPADREVLLRMQQTWLERARHEDWLDDQPPNPPVRSNALPVPRPSGTAFISLVGRDR
jgi:hypothetical protein